MINENIISQVSDRTDIVQLAGDYGLPLHKSGKDYVCCCPFHNEKTASFHISPARQRWHCFGCGADGDAFALVMKMDNLIFPEAVKKLAKRCNIEIQEEQLTPEEEQKQKKKESMYAAFQVVQEFFMQQLQANSPEAEKARRYVQSRWPDEQFTAQAGLGYAPDCFNALANFAVEKQLSTQVLVEMGVLAQTDSGKVYDVFRNRIMIPIHDHLHRIIGYTARYIGTDEKAPKYINVHTSLLYNKSRSIFGIDVAARAAAAERTFYLVEGAPDVLRMQLIGADSAVASLGTAWT